IGSSFFVSRIVAAGTVGSRHEQLNLFHIHVVPREAHVDGANHKNSSPIAADLKSLVTRGRRLGSSGHDDAIGAASPCDRGDRSVQPGSTDEGVGCAQSARQLYAFLTKISRDDDGALQPRQLSDQLSDQPEANDGYRIAQADVANPHRV